MKYWGGVGTYQNEWAELSEKLMSGHGKCDTVAGEIIRAASKVYYDGFNNGFCNNTSGAYNFLKQIGEQYLSDHEGFALCLEEIEGVVNTGGYSSVTDEIAGALDEIVDICYELIRDKPELTTTENTVDMLDLDDPDVYDHDDEVEYDEDEEDEFYD